MSYPPYGSPTPNYPGQQPLGQGGYPPQSNYGPQPGYPPQSGFQPAPPKNRTPILVGVIVGLSVLLAALGVFIYFNLFKDAGSGGSATVVAPTTQTVAPPTAAPPSSTPQPQVTVTEATTVTAPAPAPATAAPPPPPQQAAWPPPGATLCDDYTGVNSVTSCSFANEVAYSYYAYGAGTYDVYSPVTGVYHTMTCAAQTANVVYCSGGTNAEVWFRQ